MYSLIYISKLKFFFILIAKKYNKLNYDIVSKYFTILINDKFFGSDTYGR